MNNSRYLSFVRAAELHSLTKAAEELNYTQSNVSHMIQGLEEEYGFQLLVRSKNGVFLTENGEQLIDIMRGIINLENKLTQTVNRINGLQTGTLRIGSFSSVSIQWLPDIIVDFQALYPSVEIRLLNGEYHEILDWLNNGQIDCGFLTETVAQNTRFLPLIQDEMMAVIAPEKEAELSEAASLPISSYEIHRFETDPFLMPHKSHWDDVAQIFKEEKIKPNVRFEVKGDEAILALISKNLGVGLLPDLYLKSNHTQVKALPLFPPKHRTIGLALPSKYEVLPLTAVFIEWLKKWLADHNKSI